MFHRVTRSLLLAILPLCFLGACQSEPEGPAETKDLTHFTLPRRVTVAAPAMQDHLYRVIAYNTTRHKIKPVWVFIDGDRPVLGSLDPLVMRMNMMHLAYWQGKRLLWSGTLLHPVGGGGHVFSTRNYELSLRYIDGAMKLRFRDDEVLFEHGWPSDTDHDQWLEQGKRRLYVNQYVFPEELVNRHIPGGGNKTPAVFQPSNIRPLTPEALQKSLDKQKAGGKKTTPKPKQDREDQ